MKQPSVMSEREFFAFMGRRPGLVVGKASFEKVTAFLAEREAAANTQASA